MINLFYRNLLTKIKNTLNYLYSILITHNLVCKYKYDFDKA